VSRAWSRSIAGDRRRVVGLAVAPGAGAWPAASRWCSKPPEGVARAPARATAEVIHGRHLLPAGLAQGQACVQGRQMLYEYCAERAVAPPALRQTDRGPATRRSDPNCGHHRPGRGPTGRRSQLLTRAQARALEPQLECVAALHSPSTARGQPWLDAGAARRSRACGRPGGPEFSAVACGCLRRRHHLDGARWHYAAARTLINAAGLQAQTLALRFAGLEPAPVPPSSTPKATYFTLAGRSPFSRLIYPVPEAAGLGCT